MKKIAIGFALIVTSIAAFITWKSLVCYDSTILGIGTFLVLALTLVVLIWYAYDTNSIARVTNERWLREGVLSTTYRFQLDDNKNEVGKTLFRINNPSSLVVRAKVNCNFKIYGEPVSTYSAYSGKENWLIFPHQEVQGWFDIESLLQNKGKTTSMMKTEYSQANSKEQLTMRLELEFWDELGVKRVLPHRLYHFNFKRWDWIPELTEH